MKTFTSFAAAGAIALSLVLAPAAALAHGDKHERRNESGFGARVSAFVQSLRSERNELRQDWKEWRSEWKENRDTRDDRDNDENIATVSGTVTAKSGSALTVREEDGDTYTVLAADADFSGSATLSDVRVGDRVTVRGTLEGSTITASKVHDKSVAYRKFLAAIGAAGVGTATDVDSSGFTLESKLGGSAEVATDSSTQYRVNGDATTSAAVTEDSKVVVFGSTDADGDILASIVHVFTAGFDFATRIFVK